MPYLDVTWTFNCQIVKVPETLLCTSQSDAVTLSGEDSRPEFCFNSIMRSQLWLVVLMNSEVISVQAWFSDLPTCLFNTFDK